MALALLLLTSGSPDHLRLTTGDAFLLASSGPPEPQLTPPEPPVARPRRRLGAYETLPQPTAPARVFELAPEPKIVARPMSVAALTTEGAFVDPSSVSEVRGVLPVLDVPMARRERIAWEGYGAPVDRPAVPFDPAQGVADLPQPPLAPRRPTAFDALASMPPPAGPPSSALLPPGVVSYLPLPGQPTPAPRQPQPQLAPAQNVEPIVAAVPEAVAIAPPDLFTRRRRIPWEAFAQNIDPIDTPAYVASFWLSYYPSGPFPPGGLLPALQQALAEPPPIVEVTVILGAWRPEAPALFRTRPRLTPGEMAGPQDLVTLGDAYGCMTLSRVTVTAPTLLDVTVTAPVLLQPTVTHPTLLSAEVC